MEKLCKQTTQRNKTCFIKDLKKVIMKLYKIIDTMELADHQLGNHGRHQMNLEVDITVLEN